MARPAHRPALPVGTVVRVCLTRAGGRSWHIQRALRAFLAHPVPLPPDPGPGVYAITVRLDLAQVSRGMTLAKEPGRSAFIRRVLEWRYPLSTAPTKSVPVVVTPSPVTPSVVSLRPKLIPLPVAPASGRRELQFSEFRDWTERHCGGRREPQSECCYFLLASGAVEQRSLADGSLVRLWENLFQ